MENPSSHSQNPSGENLMETIIEYPNSGLVFAARASLFSNEIGVLMHLACLTVTPYLVALSFYYSIIVD
jgi:hypothetical protein